MPRFELRVVLLLCVLVWVIVGAGRAHAQNPAPLVVPPATNPSVPDVISFGPQQLTGPTSVSIRVTADTYVTLPSVYIKAIVEAQSPSFLQQEMLIAQRMQPIAPAAKPAVKIAPKPTAMPTSKPATK